MSELFFSSNRVFLVFIQIFYDIFSLIEDLLEGIQKQNDPKILKEALVLIIKDHELLKKSYKKVLNEIEKKKQMSFQFIDTLTIMRKLIFGHGAEKINGEIGSRKRLAEQEELLVHSQSLVPPPKEEEVRHLQTFSALNTLQKLLRS